MDALLNDSYFGVFLFQVLTAWPLFRILRRAGFAAAWGWVLVVPVLGPLLALMVLGHRTWPNTPPRPAPPLRKARRE